jgi:hypothetical protein
MADWPDAEELKQVLDITSDDWDDTVDRVLASAIARVKLDVGNWSETDDEPDDSLAQAALRMGELISTRPSVPASVLAADPAYRTLLTGHRRAFGFA